MVTWKWNFMAVIMLQIKQHEEFHGGAILRTDKTEEEYFPMTVFGYFSSR